MIIEDQDFLPSTEDTQEDLERETYADGRWERGGHGAISFYGEKTSPL